MILYFLFILVICVSIIREQINEALSRFFAYTFTCVWIVTLIVSTFSPYNLLPISFGTYIILSLGVISFVAGMSVPKSNYKELNNTSIYNSVQKLLSNKYVIIFLLLFIVYFLSYAREALVASAISGKAARVSADDELFVNNTTFVNIYNYIGIPLFHVLNVSLWTAIFNFKKKFLPQICIMFLYLVVFSIIGAGRSAYMVMFVYFLLMSVCKNNGTLKIGLKKLCVFAIAGYLVLLGISMMTNLRDYGTVSMTKEETMETMDDSQERIVKYATLPFVLFDHAIHHDYLDVLGGPYFGRATFAGVDTHIGTVVRKLGLPYRQTNVAVVNYVQDKWILVTSDGHDANFAYTAFFYHYMDFGVLGVIIIPFLLGLFIRRMIIRYYKYGSYADMIFIGFSFYLAVYSIFTTYLIKGWAPFFLVIVLYIGHKQCKKAGYKQ